MELINVINVIKINVLLKCYNKNMKNNVIKI